jgi:hypothetical protein
MGDLTRHVAWTCASNVFWSATIRGRRVWFGAQYSGPHRGMRAWTCSCSPGKLNPDCEHIAAARSRRCGWNAQLDPGLPPEELRQIQDDGTSMIVHRCPECHGDAHPIEVAA